MFLLMLNKEFRDNAHFVFATLSKLEKYTRLNIEIKCDTTYVHVFLSDSLY